MYLSKKNTKFILIILTILIIFLFMHGALAKAESFGESIPKTNKVYSDSPSNIDIACIRDSERLRSHITATTLYSCPVLQNYTCNNSVLKVDMTTATIDYRLAIFNTIPHFFYGSKYK